MELLLKFEILPVLLVMELIDLLLFLTFVDIDRTYLYQWVRANYSIQMYRKGYEYFIIENISREFFLLVIIAPHIKFTLFLLLKQNLPFDLFR